MLHFIDPDQFHTADVFNKFGQTEHFREAVKKCEITNVNGEQELMNESVIPMQQIQSNAAPAMQGVVQTQQQSVLEKMIISDDDDDNLLPVTKQEDEVPVYSDANTENQVKPKSNEEKV